MADIAAVRSSRIRQRRAIAALAGLVAFGLAVVSTPSATAQTFTVLYSFKGAPDAAIPEAGLIMDAAGNLYGTTDGGGLFGYGTVFKLDTLGNETVLHSFTGFQPFGSDGGRPNAPLIMDAAGNLYGTTTLGGAIGLGTVFRLDPSGNMAVLHSFTCADGTGPYAGLVMDQTGNLYGTTPGSNGCGLGTVFKLDTLGNYTVLHSFTDSPDESPQAGLIIDTTGSLYGTTRGGGPFVGTVFKLDTSGNNYTILHSFNTAPGEGLPDAGLIADATGNLYGTTAIGGAFSFGTVFKLDTSGNNYTILHNFTGADGADPEAGLLMDKAGSLYGTTQLGGSSAPNYCDTTGSRDCGTVFKLDTSGNYTVLHSFTGGSDGSWPRSALIMDQAGDLYGTTQLGGASANGTVFKLTLQTAPAPTITSISPTSAIAGGAAFTLTVNGTNFVSGSTLSFNGNARMTTFVSATQLTAAILASDIARARAGSFSVIVTNPAPGGTSNAVSFTVVTPQQATQAIINAVNALYSQGVINGGQRNSLVKTLQQAISLMNAGKNAGAIQNLNLFISEVNDLVRSGVLSSQQAAPLISAAQALIARLS